MSADVEYTRRIRDAIMRGEPQQALRAIEEALGKGIDPVWLMNEGVMAGATLLGEAFECGTAFLPELMLGGRVLKAATGALTPAIQATRSDSSFARPVRVVMATVQTDIHDIGKNCVAAMMAATGLEVIDLGVDVPLGRILEQALAADARIIGLSALLTTSLPFMRDFMGLLESRGVRDRFIVMLGGAPVTEAFVTGIGADGTAANAVQAALLAKTLVASCSVSTGEPSNA